MLKSIHGAKAGKKPFRQEVTVATTQIMSILYGLTEGEALMFGSAPTERDIKSRIYLDDTPIMSEQGETLLDVEVDYRTGTYEQSVIDGVPSVSITDNIGVEVTAANPVSRTYVSNDVTRYDVMVSIPRLFDGDDKGNSSYSTVEFAIDVAVDNEPLREYKRYVVAEKINNGYSPIYRVNVPSATNHTIRVRKITPDVTSEFDANSIYLAAITQVIEVRLAYPATALLWLKFDAEQFSSVPKLAVRFFGKSDLRIPANYNPLTREYAKTGTGTSNGVWDGTYKRGYTDNPAWIWLDLLVSDRYGLGTRITVDMVDKWELYRLAQYCDELVSNGKGGTEPRFTCNNLYLNTAEDAFKVMSDISTIFRGQIIWDGMKLRPRVDYPRDATHTFSLSSVKDLSYSSVAESATHNVVHCSYFDRENKFTQQVVTRSNREDIKRRGRFEPLELNLLGCTSKSQAERAAEYALLADSLEVRMVAFTTGLEGAIPMVGDVFYLADNFMADDIISGRIAQVAETFIVLDRDIKLTAGTLVLNTGDGDVLRIPFNKVTDGRRVELPVEAHNTVPYNLAGLMWAIYTPSKHLPEYRILETSYNESAAEWSISGITYSRDKYPKSDAAATPDDTAPEINTPDTVPAPSMITATYKVDTVQGVHNITIDVAWAAVNAASAYEIELLRDNEASWSLLATTTSLSYSIPNAELGTYTFRIRAKNSLSMYSKYTIATSLTVSGKTLPPATVTNLTTTPAFMAIDVKWKYPQNSEDVRNVLVRYTSHADPDYEPAQEIDVGAYPADTYTISNVAAGETYHISIALVDVNGTQGDYSAWVTGTSSTNVDQWLPELDGKISRNSLTPELQAELDTVKVFSVNIAINDMIGATNVRKTYMYATADTVQSPTGVAFDGIVEWLGLGSNRGIQVARDKGGAVKSRMFVDSVPITTWV